MSRSDFCFLAGFIHITSDNFIHLIIGVVFVCVAMYFLRVEMVDEEEETEE